MTAAPIGYAVEITVDVPPASKKNRRRWVRRGGKSYLIPSADAVRSANDLAASARAALAGRGMPFGPDDALHIDWSHDVASDAVTIRVTKVGVFPTRGKRGTRRDMQGMIETIADALQGVLYPNDSQLDVGSWRRVR